MKTKVRKDWLSSPCMGLSSAQAHSCTTISFFSRLHARAHFMAMSWAYHRMGPVWKGPQKTARSFVAKWKVFSTLTLLCSAAENPFPWNSAGESAANINDRFTSFAGVCWSSHCPLNFFNKPPWRTLEDEWKPNIFSSLDWFHSFIFPYEDKLDFSLHPNLSQFSSVYCILSITFYVCLLNLPPTTYKTFVMFLLYKFFFFSGLSCFNFFCPCHSTISEYIPEVRWCRCFTSLFQICQSLPLFLSLALSSSIDSSWHLTFSTLDILYLPLPHLSTIHSYQVFTACILSSSPGTCVVCTWCSCGAILSSSELSLQWATLWPPPHPTCALVTVRAVSLHGYFVH